MDPLAVFVSIGVITIAAAIWLMKKRGVMGAILGGEIVQTYGEIVSKPTAMTNTIRVHRLEKSNGSSGVVELVFSSLGTYNTNPIELNSLQVEDLIGYLQELSRDLDGGT